MRTTYYVASTVDGFIAEADGSVDYLSELGEPDPNPYEKFISSVDGLLMGRSTYDQVLGFGQWPYSELACWIATNRELDQVAGNTLAIQGDPKAMVSRIEDAGTKHLWLVGGGKLATQFLRAKLIDRLIVSIIPVALGAGIHLFEGLDAKHWFTHEQTETRSGGIIELHYSMK
ncbi:MAG: dihydrofolate reductase [Gammaproteobacteria bacterium]|nr:dihydrofolate reductase [Gammaproteobacteria bacterium]